MRPVRPSRALVRAARLTAALERARVAIEAKDRNADELQKEIDRETAKCKASFAYPEDGTSLGGLRWECMMEPGCMPLMSHLRPIEVAWIVFELSFFSDMRHQKTTRTNKRMPSKIGVGQLAYASDALVVVSFALRCAMEVIAGGDYVDDSGEAMDTAEDRLKNIYTSYQIVISVKVALIFLQKIGRAHV